MTRTILSTASLALVAALSVSALANDFTAGGTPADLVPVNESRIAMKSEDIVMEFTDGRWKVTADYVFLNATDRAITQKIGFPEINCDKNAGYDCVPNAFKNLLTTVDGVAARHSKGSITPNHEWSKDLGPVWLFDASFPPGKPTKIAHSYDVFTGSNLSWIYDIDYLVKTGRGWAGPIGNASFRVKLPLAAHTVAAGDFPGPPRLVEEPNVPAHFLLERKEMSWVPPTSVATFFVFTAWSDISERLGPDRFSRSGVAKEDECVSPISPETAAQAQMCKNLIYAISGYPFKSEKLRKYFYGNSFEWRRVKDHPLGDVWIRGLRPFENFTSSSIPALDRSFLRHLEGLKFEGGTPTETLPWSAPSEAKADDALADATLKAALAHPEKAGPGKAKDKRAKSATNEGSSPKPAASLGSPVPSSAESDTPAGSAAPHSSASPASSATQANATPSERKACACESSPGVPSNVGASVVAFLTLVLLRVLRRDARKTSELS